MKIAIVAPVMVPVPPKKYGGIEVIVDLLAHGLAERHHSVTVFCAGSSTIVGEGITRVESSPYPTSEHSEENRAWEEKQLHAVLKHEEEFDVIHFHYEPIIFRMMDDGKEINLLDRLHRPAVLTFHNTTDIPEHIEYYRTHESLYRHTMTFISKNQRSRVSFIPNTQVIYNAIPIDQFSVENKKGNYFLFLGRIMRKKGILEAIAVAKQTGTPLIIAAKIDPIDRIFYQREVEPFVDGTFIRYVGEVDFLTKVEYFKNAYCLLFPITWEEPFGLVMIEALACGTPVVAFRRGSVPEIIIDGKTGFVVDTIKEMVEATKKIDQIDRSFCRKYVEETFRSEKMITEYEKLFLKISTS